MLTPHGTVEGLVVGHIDVHSQRPKRQSDPDAQRVLVLALREGRYVEHATWSVGDLARPVTIAGVEVDIGAMFATASHGA